MPERVTSVCFRYREDCVLIEKKKYNTHLQQNVVAKGNALVDALDSAR